MKMRTVSLIVTLLLLLAGCGGETSDNKTKSDASSTPVDEVTTIDELPTILGEGLTPEEKEELRKQILPTGSEDEATAEEKFKALLERAKGGEPKAQNFFPSFNFSFSQFFSTSSTLFTSMSPKT